MKYWKQTSLFLIAAIITSNTITLSTQWKPLTLTVCFANSSRFANTNNDTRVIDVTDGSTVHLWCHYCNTKEDYSPKRWFYMPRETIHLKQTMKEIETSDDAPDKNISISLTHNLNLNCFKPNNSGIYTCRSYENKNKNKFTYVLDGVIYVEVSPKVGTVSQWQEYKRIYTDPINKKFKLSEEEPYKTFRRNDLIFNVYTVWDNWSECKDIDGHQKGKRKRLGRCRICLINNIKNHFTKSTFKNNFTRVIISYITDGYDVPCRSLKLNRTMPELSSIITNIPEYEAEEICSISKKAERKPIANKTKHKTIHQVMEDSHVTLICNEAMPNSDLKWFKDKKLLKSLYGNIFNKKEDEPHISIDASNSLHILHISKNEEGNYTCSVNGKKVKQFEVKVVSKSKLLNQEFIRYSIYLGFVLSLTMTCYCAGVCVAWHRRASFADPLNLYRKKPYINSEREHEKLLD